MQQNELQNSGWLMPAEWVKHAATWMVWPHNQALWESGWRVTLAQVQKDFAGVANAIARFEPVKMVVDPSAVASAKALVRSQHRTDRIGGERQLVPRLRPKLRLPPATRAGRGELALQRVGRQVGARSGRRPGASCTQSPWLAVLWHTAEQRRRGDSCRWRGHADHHRVGVAQSQSQSRG